MNKETGGCAFPCHSDSTGPEPGISIRDYFAAKAMQALIGIVGQNAAKGDADDAVCGVAYIYADKMLLAREVFYDYSKKEEVKEGEQ